MSNGMAKTLSKGKAKELNGLLEQLMQLGAPDYDTVEACLDQHRNMYGVLERIRRLEPKLRTTNDRPRMENVENFTKWATGKGCTLKNVRIAEQAEYGGLGLEATGTISDTFIEVPRSLFFYIDDGARFKNLLLQMPANMMRDQGNVMLALALIMERFRKNSFWEPYFDVFPVRYTTPLYYTPDDARELINTEAFHPALKLCKTIARQYGFIRKVILQYVDELQNNFTYDVFR
ncbi:AGAP002018-PA-like protein [Anopheles sinensis]|uniref:protein-histidine N-methyltransferase n=1 Tax=Anopheles sinensis TaxID=74873 RepID=A0A084VHB9_ANOSI|nr:AGAP002018-PA-like protein [Anopheles sinensis]